MTRVALIRTLLTGASNTTGSGAGVVFRIRLLAILLIGIVSLGRGGAG